MPLTSKVTKNSGKHETTKTEMFEAFLSEGQSKTHEKQLCHTITYISNFSTFRCPQDLTYTERVSLAQW